MLQSLYLENIALIEKLGIELFPGFNVLTGETGAGKSIIIDAATLYATAPRGQRLKPCST